MINLSLTVRVSSLVSTVLIIVASLSTRINDGNDTDGFHIMFSWHPVFNSIGLFLLTQGIVSYITSFGSKADAMFPDRNSRRVLHGSCQLFACAFIILGYMVALGSHAIFKLSNVGTGGVSQAYTVHTWLGYVSLVLILFQVGAGLKKFVVRTRDDKNSVSYHGVLGPLVYVFAMATGIAGVNALVPDQPVWRAIISVMMSFTALVTVLFVFYGPAEVRERARRAGAAAAAMDLDINQALIPGEIRK